MNYYDTEYDAMYSLMRNISNYDKRCHIMHYIDNNFYKNDFVFTGGKKQRYYKILKRRVTDWQDLDSEEELYFDNGFITNNKNNIIYLKNSIDNLKNY